MASIKSCKYAEVVRFLKDGANTLAKLVSAL